MLVINPQNMRDVPSHGHEEGHNNFPTKKHLK